ALQLPEGLQMFACTIADIIERIPLLHIIREHNISRVKRGDAGITLWGNFSTAGKLQWTRRRKGKGKNEARKRERGFSIKICNSECKEPQMCPQLLPQPLKTTVPIRRGAHVQKRDLPGPNEPAN
ncbi:hypothetical protein ILYODFUR_029923, partial [Ilyodon furcidens]